MKRVFTTSERQCQKSSGSDQTKSGQMVVSFVSILPEHGKVPKIFHAKSCHQSAGRVSSIDMKVGPGNKTGLITKQEADRIRYFFWQPPPVNRCSGSHDSTLTSVSTTSSIWIRIEHSLLGFPTAFGSY